MDHARDARDLALALEIYQQLNNQIGVTVNGIIPKNIQERDYIPKTLVDTTLEFNDPTPNIHTLFVQFDARYFWNKLSSVEVKWSNKMTTCAGVCTYHPRNCRCVITLSAPLLKLRPRKDLVETLLHEMIHGYLFLTNSRDKGEHGPEFHKHMYRINTEAKTQITVYHNFHDEVRFYQQHWWRCNGPCQKIAPYFGMVRRAMNRVPGPRDVWWGMHQKTCSGQFIKVQEPSKPPVKKKKLPSENRKTFPNVPKSKDISEWLTKPDKSIKLICVDANVPAETIHGNPVGSKPTNKSVVVINTPSTFVKVGNASNNIHGWDTGGPNSSAPSSHSGIKRPKFHASGVLGGSKSGRSNLLDKFFLPKASGQSKLVRIPGPCNGRNISSTNEIVDLTQTPHKRKNSDYSETHTKLPKINAGNLPENTKCPVCEMTVTTSKLNDHLDECLIWKSNSEMNQNSPKSKTVNDRQNDPPQASNILISSSLIHILDSSDSDYSESRSNMEDTKRCLVCDDLIDPGVTLNDHLEVCLGFTFTDNLITEIEEIDVNIDSNQVLDKNFPCPICMTPIIESLMNQHLDTCLSQNLLKNYIA